MNSSTYFTVRKINARKNRYVITYRTSPTVQIPVYVGGKDADAGECGTSESEHSAIVWFGRMERLCRKKRLLVVDIDVGSGLRPI